MAAKKTKAKKPKVQNKPDDIQIWKRDLEDGEITLDLIWMNEHYSMLFLRNVSYGPVGSDTGLYFDPEIAEELIDALNHALEHAYTDGTPCSAEENNEKEESPELPTLPKKDKITN